MRNVWLIAALLAALGRATAALAADADIPVVRNGDGARALGITMPTAANKRLVDAYPAYSKRMGEEGMAQLSFVVNTDGTTSDVRIDETTAPPHLTEAAIAAVRNWPYRPATRDGNPVAVRTRVYFRWHLAGTRPHNLPSRWEIFEMTSKDFPPGAHERGEVGVTALLVSLDAQGNVVHVSVNKSSGYPDLDAAAERIAQSWHPSPVVLQGKPIKSLIAAAFDWSSDQNEVRVTEY